MPIIIEVLKLMFYIGLTIFMGFVALFLFILAEHKEEVWGCIGEKDYEFDD